MKLDSKSKTPKYWYQSTGRGMRDDRTIRPASGLKRKPCIRNAIIIISFDSPQ